MQGDDHEMVRNSLATLCDSPYLLWIALFGASYDLILEWAGVVYVEYVTTCRDRSVAFQHSCWQEASLLPKNLGVRVAFRYQAVCMG